MCTSTGNGDIHPVLDRVDKRVTQEMNKQLMAPFTREEIETAMRQMNPAKSPSPDGISPLFY